LLSERTGALFERLERQAGDAVAEVARLRAHLRRLEAENARLREALSRVEEGIAAASESAAASRQAVSESHDRHTATAVPAAGPSTHLVDSEPPPSPRALLNQWYQRYPQAFFKGHTRPLKVGIHQDLLAREPWPEKLVRRALACYVHLPRYLKAVRAGAERVDLDGRAAGAVGDEEARHARSKLDALRADKAAEREARRRERLDRKLGDLLAKHHSS